MKEKAPHLLPCYDAPSPVLTSGKGVWLWDDDTQKDYIDLAGGVAVNALGHCHPALLKTITEQANKLWHLSNWWLNQPALDLAKKICELSFGEQVFLCNSGAEANEAALKLALKYSIDNFGKNKNQIIACPTSFHGRTMFTASLTGKYLSNAYPLNIKHIEFNNTEQLPKSLTDECCALIIEPIIGEGGVISANLDFLQTARELCTRHNCLLIFDEIQCGMGRTGSLFAYLDYGVTPDIMTLAKALGSGFPIGAMVTKRNIGESMGLGVHGSTFGGNPLACAVALESIKQIQKLLPEQVVKSSQILRTELTKLGQQYKLWDCVRGKGLLLGCVLNEGVDGKALQRACFENGLLVLTAAAHQVLRFAPPLNISAEELSIASQRLEQVLSKFAK